MSLPRLLNNYLRVDCDKKIMVSVTPKQIKMTEAVINMDFDKRECYLPYERELKYFNFYTVSNCLLECLTNITLKSCGCVLYYMPSKEHIHNIILYSVIFNIF